MNNPSRESEANQRFQECKLFSDLERVVLLLRKYDQEKLAASLQRFRDHLLLEYSG